MTVFFVVRAEVPEAERAAFDHWYATDHLPQVVAAAQARRAWRCWSRSEPAVHVAFYEFPDLAVARAFLAADAIKPLVADFDRRWGDRVIRKRAILETVQEITG